MFLYACNNIDDYDIDDDDGHLLFHLSTLKVSYCGQSMSVTHLASCVVRRAASTVAVKPSTPTPLDQLTQNLIRSIRMTC